MNWEAMNEISEKWTWLAATHAQQIKNKQITMDEVWKDAVKKCIEDCKDILKNQNNLYSDEAVRLCIDAMQKILKDMEYEHARQ